MKSSRCLQCGQYFMDEHGRRSYCYTCKWKRIRRQTRERVARLRANRGGEYTVTAAGRAYLQLLKDSTK